MPVHTSEFRLSTSGDAEIVDITDRVQAAVAEAGVAEGQATAFIRGSTAAITTMEYEPGGIHDLQALLDRLIPARATTSTTGSTTTPTPTHISGPRSSAPRRWFRSWAAAWRSAPGSSWY